MGNWLWLNTTALAPLLPITLCFGAQHLLATSSHAGRQVYQDINKLRSWALVAFNRYVTDVMQETAKPVDMSETALVVGGFLACEVSRLSRLSGATAKTL